MSLSSLNWLEWLTLRILVAVALLTVLGVLLKKILTELVARVNGFFFRKWLEIEGMNGRHALMTPSMGSRPVTRAVKAACLV